MLSDKINERIDDLYKQADAMGKWKEAAVGLDHQRRSKRAELRKQVQGTNDAKTDYAESHHDYVTLCAQVAEAEGQYTRLKARHDIALAAMSVWQTCVRIEHKELQTLRHQ